MIIENLFDLRRNGHLIVAKAAILIVFLIVVYSTASFAESTESAVSTSFSSDADQNLYSLTDTLVDGEFAEFRQDPAAVGRVGEFYNELNASSTVSLVSAFAQPVVVADFRGGDEFDARSDSEYASPGEYVDATSGRAVRDVRSVQMNQKAFEFAGLSLSSGTVPDWATIDYSSGTIPVVLGSDYAGVYALGDVLEGQYYSGNFSLQVAGFLAADSSMYYKSDINFFLDDYVLLPYPAELTTPTHKDLFFTGILAFAMVNSDVAASKSLSSDDVIAHLASVASDSGFHDYALINVPQYLTQFSLTRALLLDNAQLVGMLQALLALVIVFVIAAVSAFIFRRRAPALSVRWITGTNDSALWGSLASMVLFEWVLVAVGFWLVYTRLPNGDSNASGTVVLVLLVCAAIDVGASTVGLRRRLLRGRET
jgi:putative ABC transport system permease protein